MSRSSILCHSKNVVSNRITGDQEYGKAGQSNGPLIPGAKQLLFPPNSNHFTRSLAAINVIINTISVLTLSEFHSDIFQKSQTVRNNDKSLFKNNFDILDEIEYFIIRCRGKWRGNQFHSG